MKEKVTVPSAGEDRGPQSATTEGEGHRGQRVEY